MQTTFVCSHSVFRGEMEVYRNSRPVDGALWRAADKASELPPSRGFLLLFLSVSLQTGSERGAQLLR